MYLGKEGAKASWRENLRISLTGLVICLAALYGYGTVFIDEQHQARLSNTPPDFWFSQEGPAFLMIVLMWAYVFCMSRPRLCLELQE